MLSLVLAATLSCNGGASTVEVFSVSFDDLYRVDLSPERLRATSKARKGIVRQAVPVRDIDDLLVGLPPFPEPWNGGDMRVSLLVTCDDRTTYDASVDGTMTVVRIGASDYRQFDPRLLDLIRPRLPDKEWRAIEARRKVTRASVMDAGVARGASIPVCEAVKLAVAFARRCGLFTTPRVPGASCPGVGHWFGQPTKAAELQQAPYAAFQEEGDQIIVVVFQFAESSYAGLSKEARGEAEQLGRAVAVLPDGTAVVRHVDVDLKAMSQKARQAAVCK